MQGAKKAGETIKETAANIGASAKSGMDKTKATVQEKVFCLLNIFFVSSKFNHTNYYTFK